MNEDGTCPTCGRLVEAPKRQPITSKTLNLRELAAGEDGEESAKAPWHFKLLVGGTVVYLGYRFLQGVEWLAHKL